MEAGKSSLDSDEPEAQGTDWSSNLRKVSLLLDALDKKGIPASYYALDLSREELERTLAEIPAGRFKHVKCFGLWGTYDDGLAWLNTPKNTKRSKTVLWLGSSIGNLNRKEAAEFLTSFRKVLGTNDNFLLAVDECTKPEKVYRAYNDSQGLTHKFVLNGLEQANELLGYPAFDLDHWKVIGEYDTIAGRHHAFVSPDIDLEVEGAQIRAGEKIRIEESYKYDRPQLSQLLEASGFAQGVKWSNTEGDYGESHSPMFLSLFTCSAPDRQCIAPPRLDHAFNPSILPVIATFLSTPDSDNAVPASGHMS